jgi:hypothetical protein
LETDSKEKKLRHLHCVSNGFSSFSHQFSVLDLKSLCLRSHASWTCSGTTGHSWKPYPTLPLRAAMSLRVRHYPQLCSDTNNLSGVIYANLWLWVRGRQELKQPHTLRCRLAVKHLKNGIPIQGFSHHGMVLGQIGGQTPKNLCVCYTGYTQICCSSSSMKTVIEMASWGARHGHGMSWLSARFGIRN